MAADGELFRAIATAPSFWRGLALYGAGFAGALALSLALLAGLHRRARPGPLACDERGAAAAVDFVLTMPVFIVFVSLAVQFAVMLNATLVIHYAAFSAARSARAWVVETAARSPLPIQSVPIALAVPAEVERHAASAARMALVSVSPADPEIASTAVDAPVGTLRAVAAAAGLAPRGDAFAAKARYAFDPRNASVEVRSRWRDGAPAVTASVEYRIHTGILAGRVLGSDRGDGVRARAARAEVTLQ